MDESKITERGVYGCLAVVLFSVLSIEWLDHGVRLYDVLDRASCWLCRNKNMRELKAIHEHLPVYWERLIALEGVCGQMKSRPLSEIAGA